MAFLHASKSGYFPFCLEEAIEGDYGVGTLRPFEMSLEDAMALYWKYKSFKITGSITGSFSGELGPGFESFEFQINGTGALIETGQPKMTNLVCNDIHSLILFISNDYASYYITASPLYQGQTVLDSYIGNCVKKTPTPNSGQKLKIYPYVVFSVAAVISSQTGASGSPFIVTGIDDNSDPGTYSQTTISDGFQIKINGTTYKQTMYVLFYNLLSGSASGSLIIEGGEERLAE